MWVIGPIGFTAPWILSALAALPVLWWLLRAVPPAPVRQRFPGVVLLDGLKDARREAERTPWWLLALRLLAVAALIIAFAGPVLNPSRQVAGEGPLLVVLDGTWADARDWPRRQERLSEALSDAGRAGRPVAVVMLSEPPAGADLPFQAAQVWTERVSGLKPQPWGIGQAALTWASALEGGFETLWLSDGLQWPVRPQLLAALEARGPVRVFESGRPLLALTPPEEEEGRVTLAVKRVTDMGAASAVVLAIGPDPAGTVRELARRSVEIPAGSRDAQVVFELPPELRNRIQRFEIEGARSAAAVALADDSLRRRKVALISGREEREGLQLLSPTHYLRQALLPVAELYEGSITDTLLAAPDVVILADVARMSFDEEEALSAWAAKGGLLLRFAGPRLAAAQEGRAEDHPLLPVRLREGGRTVGGAMSWGEPRHLAPFAPQSPFFGLTVPQDVTINAQVLAQPDPALAERTIATLADGTPLVTRMSLGAGQVVLFHITANAEWSSLPLSGLFMQMLERLAVSARSQQAGGVDLTGTSWQVMTALDAFGRGADGAAFAAVEGGALAAAAPMGETSALMPPGVYASGERRFALNVMGVARELSLATWPSHITPEGETAEVERSLKGAVLAVAVLALLVDVLAMLWLMGLLRRSAASILVLGALAFAPGAEAQGQPASPPPPASAEADAFAQRATADVVLGYVLTGDQTVDDLSRAGLLGLGTMLTNRTTIEPAAPMGVDLEKDEIAFFPFLYWPVTADQPMPSPAAYRKLNQFLRSGGLILFDTRDGDVADFGAATPEGARLQILAEPLDIPPLEPVPEDHVLTRTFYLLQDFPGRHQGRTVWVEAAPVDAEQAEGMPFRNLNDGVTPVVIGGNDWASAWAIDARGVPVLPVGRGFTGEHQREMSWRFGINLIMHVLTGNYKSDQVHVPALLERLGQ